MDIKTISVAVGLVVMLSGIAYKGVTFTNKTVTKVETNATDIKILSARVSLQELQDLLDAARRERNYLLEELRKYPNRQDLKDKLTLIEEEIADLKERIKEKKKEKRGENVD